MKKIGKYEILSILGKGAMGIVYKALDPDINRQVAIKTVRFDLAADQSGTASSEEIMQRFIREAQAAGRLSHPNIITIYDVGREKDLTYIVMQYIEGPSIQRMIAQGDRLSIQKVVTIMDQVCSALNYAHQNGIIHRDMKPGNILLDKDAKPYICDFGVARIDTSTLTQSGTAVGTPSYMSPEQVMGKKVDKRTDIFSLGCILYEVLTGRRPFEAESITTVIYKIINEEPPALTEVKKGLPLGFERIISKALAKDPNERYQSCSLLAADLRNLDRLSERTIAITTGKEAYLHEEKQLKPEKRKSKLGLVLGTTLPLVIITAAGVFFFHYKTGQLPFVSAVYEKITGEKLILENQAKTIALTLEEKLNKAEESYGQGNYVETIRLAQEVLVEDAGNEIAQGYLERASKALKPQDNSTIETPSASQGSTANPEASPVTEEMLSSLRSSFENKNYEETKRLAREILAFDAANTAAQDYLNKAEDKIQEAAFITQTLRSGVRSYENKNYIQCKREMDRILKLDKTHKQARQYWNLADTAIYEVSAEKEIQQIVERNRKAEETEDFLSLLMDIGSSSLKTQKQMEAKLLFNNYDDIRSVVSSISVEFQNRRQALVRFSNLLTALNINTGKKVSFEKAKIWTMEKQENSWKIIKEEIK